MSKQYLNLQVGEPLTIAKPIGRGHLSAVYAAVHPVLARRFAVKVLGPKLIPDEDTLRRLRRMVREASTVEHPNIIALSGFGQLDDGSVYLIMDYARGIQLTKALERDGRFETARALPILLQVADALEEAHCSRVFHADVKPNNILLLEARDGSETIRLHDFKLMQALSQRATQQDPVAHLRLYANFDYLSPEQINDSRVDGRADIYSFGALAYRMLCGEPPFYGTLEEVIQGHRLREPVPPSRRAGVHDVSPALDAVVLRCLEKRPEDRFRSMEEVLQALRGLMAPPRVQPVEPAPVADGDDAVTGRWQLAEPEEVELEEPLPASPARVRQLFYDTLLELTELVVNQGTANESLVYEHSAIRRAKDEASKLAGDAAATENRFEDIRRELRERESTLRYAIIDLNLAKADMQQSASSEDVRDVDFQIAELERSLSDLERQRSVRFEELNQHLASHKDQLKALEQTLAKHYRRLYAHLEDVRAQVPPQDGRRLFRVLERCRDAMASVTA